MGNKMKYKFANKELHDYLKSILNKTDTSGQWRGISEEQLEELYDLSQKNHDADEYEDLISDEDMDQGSDPHELAIDRFIFHKDTDDEERQRLQKLLNYKGDPNEFGDPEKFNKLRDLDPYEIVNLLNNPLTGNVNTLQIIKKLNPSSLKNALETIWEGEINYAVEDFIRKNYPEFSDRELSDATVDAREMKMDMPQEPFKRASLINRMANLFYKMATKE